MAYLEELLPEFRNGAKIRRKYWGDNDFVEISDFEKGLIFTNKELEASDWEFYQESIDWETIIKNKYLCWFWDDGKECVKDLDFLESKGNRFLDVHGFRWDNCRPVRKDEVTFYEDKK